MEERKGSYWDVWYSNPENKKKKRQYARDRYYSKRDEILASKRERLSNETEEQRSSRLQKMRDYYYEKRNDGAPRGDGDKGCERDTF